MPQPDRHLIVEHPALLARGLEPGSCLLGIDLGARTIGVAISDPTLTIASPLLTLPRTRLGSDAGRIADLGRQRRAAGLVVGLPINMDGSEGRRAQATRDWSAALAERIACPVAFWDERLSTMAVERVMLQADMTRKRRARKIDQAAACYILQAALDAIPAFRDR